MTLMHESAVQDMIPAAEARTLHGLFLQRVERTPAGVAYREYDRSSGRWRDFSWSWMAGEVGRWRQGLAQEKLSVGDRVGILLPNGVAWVCLEQAALSLGLVVVPLYLQDNPENQLHVLRDSGCRVALVGTAEQWKSLSQDREVPAALERILSLEPGDRAGPVLPVEGWLPPADPGAWPEAPDDPEALATIVYTSGTTGTPKGVMLSHRNILWNAEAVLRRIPAYTNDVFLSFLPLSHTFERTVGYYIPMMAGCTVAYARSVKELAEDLRTIRPTVLVSVPRIYERVYARVQENLLKRGTWARFLFKLAVDEGYRAFEARQGRARRTVANRILWPILRRLVADKVMARLGGRIRVAVSGGAPLQERIARFFIGLGLPLLQGYGLTETAPVLSANRPDNNLPDSVGEPLPGVECRISPDGELLVNSPGLMLGYWNRPGDTASAIDEDGRLHTGDMAELRDGRIFIVGRLKELLVTSTGEKIPPAPLEQRLGQIPLFHQALVVGEGMASIGVVAVLNNDEWETFADGLGRNPDDPASLNDQKVKDAVLKIIARSLHDQPSASQVHHVYLTLEPWTIENGLLTATLKLKRAEIERKLAGPIAEMFQGHGQEADLL